MNLTPAFASVLAVEIAPIDYGKIFGACFLATTLVAVLAFSLRGLWLIFEKAGVEAGAHRLRRGRRRTQG